MNQKKEKVMAGIFILISIVVLISVHIARESYVSKFGSSREASEIEQNTNDKIEPIPPIESKTTPVSDNLESTTNPEVSVQIKSHKEEYVKEDLPKKRGRKPSPSKDSYTSKGARRGHKPKKEGGNDLLLS